MVSICSAGFLIVFFAILTRHASTGGVTKLLSINVDEFYSINVSVQVIKKRRLLVRDLQLSN